MARTQVQQFAADTSSVTGETKRDINRHIVRAEALGDDLDAVIGTSLDKGVELDALKVMTPEQRAPLIAKAQVISVQLALIMLSRYYANITNMHKGTEMFNRNLSVGIFIIGILVGCASFSPVQGMSFSAFDHMAKKSMKGAPILVQTTESMEVYRIDDSQYRNVFYWFERGRLARVSQELPQKRYQIEHINR